MVKLAIEIGSFKMVDHLNCSFNYFIKKNITLLNSFIMPHPRSDMIIYCVSGILSYGRHRSLQFLLSIACWFVNFGLTIGGDLALFFGGNKQIFRTVSDKLFSKDYF